MPVCSANIHQPTWNHRQHGVSTKISHCLRPNGRALAGMAGEKEANRQPACTNMSFWNPYTVEGDFDMLGAAVAEVSSHCQPFRRQLHHEERKLMRKTCDETATARADGGWSFPILRLQAPWTDL
jgi:hypothetical protein